MSGYTIANLNIEENRLRDYYSQAKKNTHISDFHDLDLIFEIALNSQGYFPGISLTGQLTPENYINRWVNGYCNAIANLPSSRTAKPKSSCTDPAIRIIVQSTQGLTNDEAISGENFHNLFMSAENIQGNLLEQYIAHNIRPYGFLWCIGNVLRAIDFCNSNGTFMLQIKNKSNTENSSSSNIREGTTIEKWFRLGTRAQNGVKYPVYKWDSLNTLINSHKTDGFNLPPCNMTEHAYNLFLKRISIDNENLISNL